MARVKFDVNKLPHERIPKKTSIAARRPKFSSMNKHFSPEILITAIPDFPSGVESAKIVDFKFLLISSPHN